MAAPSLPVTRSSTPLRKAASPRTWRFSPALRAWPVALLAVVLVLTLLGPLVCTRDPLAQDLGARLQGPSAAYPLGTDAYGRDILSRLLAGGRWSLLGATVVSLGTSFLGFTLAALAATGNSFLDYVISRLIEALLAIPGLVPALALTAVLGPSFRNLLFALIITGWPSLARLYRGIILAEITAPYVEGAAALGASRLRVVVRHVLPNIAGPVIVLATSHFGAIILGLSALSFLGLGMQPPTPEWGAMIDESRVYFQSQPAQMILPGLCIVVTVLAVNLTGDLLHDHIARRDQ